MNKCFIEYPNHNLYICYDDVFCYINLVLDKQDSMYHFIQFVYQTKHMLYGIKQVNKFKSKNCYSKNYKDTFADNNSIDRLKTKIPFLFRVFCKIWFAKFTYCIYSNL